MLFRSGCAAGQQATAPCAADGTSATLCAPCQPFSSSAGGATAPGPCACDSGFVLVGAACRWTPTPPADSDAHALRSVERLYPPPALRAAGVFAWPDDESPDVHEDASASYAAGRYAVAYSSIETAPGYTGYGPYNALGNAGAASWALFNVWRVAARQGARIGEGVSGSSKIGLRAEE